MMQSFTPLEMDILECLASFWSVEDICRELEGSPKKIRSYIAGIRKKLAPTEMADTGRIEQYEALCTSARKLFHTVQYYALNLSREC